MITRIQRFFDTFFDTLFDIITRPSASSQIVRFALTFLDIWQANVSLYQTTWIQVLIDGTQISTGVWVAFLCILAVLAFISMFIYRALWLAAIVLAANTALYLVFFFSGVFSNMPRSSAGFSLFVILISFSAFLRVFLEWLKERTIRKRI